MLNKMLNKIKNEISRFFVKQLKKSKKYENYFLGDGHFIKSYSQSAEDAVINTLINCCDNKGLDYKGFYIDVGAHQPFKLSNTQFFHEHGWRGINIDANPNSMNLFKEHRKNDINLEFGVGAVEADLKFNIYNNPAFNCFESDVSKGYKGIEYLKLQKQVNIKVYPLDKILNKYLPQGQYIDFLSIDVEGLDLDVLKSNNWEKYRPTYILVEYIHDGYNIDNITKCPKAVFLKEQGYNVIAVTPLTLIFKNTRIK